jgi:aspartate kinase
MKIYKFGGASVQNSDGIKNVAQIISNQQKEALLVVVSAIGKTTNALEHVTEACYYNKPELNELLLSVKKTHLNIIEELFDDEDVIYINEVENLFLELECLAENDQLHEDFDFLYDQIVTYGELISSRILSSYLLKLGIRNQWIDARNFIITDQRYRDANVQWEETEKIIQSRLLPLSKKNLIITQGFMGRGPKGETTTLGREGSDYSAAIFGKSLQAESVTIWKDVPGVLNADPKRFAQTQLLPELSYNDAIELAYYGASVIHPKTIQPLKAAKIPLFVRSFVDMALPGTKVYEGDHRIQNSCYILKDSQWLFEISSSDFSFIAEGHLRDLFDRFSKHKVRVNIMQNSAIRFRFSIDHREHQHAPLIADLKSAGFIVNVQSGLKLLSVYQPEPIKAREEALKLGSILLEQQIESTAHFLIN